MEIVDVGFFEYNTDGELLYGNEAFHKLSGHPKVGIVGYTWLDCVYEEDKEDLLQRWIALSNGKPSTFEMRWKGPADALSASKTSAPADDADAQWVLAACLPILGRDGETLRVSGCLTDIAAQKRSESDALKRAEALERAHISERRFTRLADNANVGIFIANLEKKIVYCNSEWFTITGHPVVDFADVSWAGHLLAEDMVTVAENWNQMIDTKQPQNYQLRWYKPWLDAQGARGTPHTWTMCSVYPESNKDGDIISAAGFITDISHLIWAESAQKQRTDEAVEAKRQQENFIDMTCHEIRNPLGAVMHCADLIESTASEIAELLKDTLPSLPSEKRSRYESLSKSSAEAVDTIVSCSTHQKRIMDDILTLSKLDSKLLTIVPSLSKVDDILKIAEKMFEVDARKVDITLQVRRERIDGEPKVDWVMLDGGRLMQVLINLLTNALKFTQKEARKVVTVSMRVSQAKLSEQDLGVELVPVSTVRDRQLVKSHTAEEVYLYFKVVDSGCGFDNEQKLAIFERFAQASPRTHSSYGGSGLGLHITRELIEMQGGEIGVSSQPGEGSTFAFYITAPIASAPEVKSTDTKSLAAATPANTSETMASYTILVVEDNLVNQKVMQRQLVKMGHKIYVASNGIEALAFLATTSCWKDNADSPIQLSVITMDIEMPIMDGVTCTREIRAAEAIGDIVRHVPIIAVSANARHEQINFAIECGMDDAISKPFRITELIPKIERLSRVRAIEPM
ncbi:hypothetical protein B0A48_18008 [Cryoendolithus antarcticus]|uniref:histidine kinase n=1 Tax=Cryoendolithus antarcticus TaxID=1507870 RepID=A0A1V8SAJ0_9PEZI|nr:hypothetical protein B0A48_18008 [Cryoendolithus antarcticus]